LNKLFRYGPAALSFFLIAGMGAAQDWFLSNAGGMALEPVFSRLALRNKYGLSVDRRAAGDIPEQLRPYYDPAYTVELRTLYEEGKESRRQWICRDGTGTDRLAAVIGDDGAGFIEIYDESGQLTEERQFSQEEGEQILTFSYNQGLLIRSALRLGAEELWTDHYRYSRSHSLRAIERVFHTGADLVRLSFPRAGLAAAAEDGFTASDPVYGSDFLRDILIQSGDRILYTTDEQGRVIREVRQDREGTIRGEIVNTWSGTRLGSIRWIPGGTDAAGTDDGGTAGERLVEYEYDDEGGRIVERNYRDGALERLIRREGEVYVEELYMNGQMILRAVWDQNDRKISEERIRPGMDAAGANPAGAADTGTDTAGGAFGGAP
jgi:hypothetical protein